MPTGLRSFQSASLLVCTPTGLPAHMHDGVVELTHIRVPDEDQRKGYGTALLKAVCEEADERTKVLFLTAESTGPLSNTQLCAWYTRFGFKLLQSTPILMARQPRVPGRLVSPIRRAVRSAVSQVLH